MAYTDAQGRPEIVMHPDIVRGAADHRIVTRRIGDVDPTGAPAAARAGDQVPPGTEPAERPAGALGAAVPAQQGRP